MGETCTLPTDVAKTRLQTDSVGRYKGSLVACLRSTAGVEGVGALWKGLQPALIRQVCYSSLAMVLFEGGITLGSYVEKRDGRERGRPTNVITINSYTHMQFPCGIAAAHLHWQNSQQVFLILQRHRPRTCPPPQRGSWRT